MAIPKHICICIIGCSPDEGIHSVDCICVMHDQNEVDLSSPRLRKPIDEDLCTRYEGGMCGCSRCAMRADRGEL